MPVPCALYSQMFKFVFTRCFGGAQTYGTVFTSEFCRKPTQVAYCFSCVYLVLRDCEWRQILFFCRGIHCFFDAHGGRPPCVDRKPADRIHVTLSVFRFCGLSSQPRFAWRCLFFESLAVRHCFRRLLVRLRERRMAGLADGLFQRYLLRDSTVVVLGPPYKRKCGVSISRTVALFDSGSADRRPGL